MQFSVQSILYNLRKYIPIHFMCFIKADIFQILIGVFNDRRVFIRMDRRDFLNHICDLIGIGNNNFLCLLTSQIRKFFQHLFCCTQIQRCLIICIGETISRHNDTSISLILRIHKVHIAGSNNRFLKLISQFNDFFINLDQIFI